jgi:hypothetical protein
LMLRCTVRIANEDALCAPTREATGRPGTRQGVWRR